MAEMTAIIMPKKRPTAPLMVKWRLRRMSRPMSMMTMTAIPKAAIPHMVSGTPEEMVRARSRRRTVFSEKRWRASAWRIS